MKVVAIALMTIALSHVALGQQKAHPVTHTPVKPVKPVISGPFKRTVAAAIDPTSTEAEVRTYVRDARLLITTKGDNLVFAKLLIAVGLLDLAKNDDYLKLQNDRAYDAVVANYDMIEARWAAEETPEVPSFVVHGTKAEADTWIAEDLARRHKPVDDAYGEMRKALTFKNAEALRLIDDKFSALRAGKDEFASVRSDLGLPPILTAPEMK